MGTADQEPIDLDENKLLIVSAGAEVRLDAACDSESAFALGWPD